MLKKQIAFKKKEEGEVYKEEAKKDGKNVEGAVKKKDEGEVYKEEAKDRKNVEEANSNQEER